MVPSMKRRTNVGVFRGRQEASMVAMEFNRVLERKEPSRWSGKCKCEMKVQDPSRMATIVEGVVMAHV